MAELNEGVHEIHQLVASGPLSCGTGNRMENERKILEMTQNGSEGGYELIAVTDK